MRSYGFKCNLKLKNYGIPKNLRSDVVVLVVVLVVVVEVVVVVVVLVVVVVSSVMQASEVQPSH